MPDPAGPEHTAEPVPRQGYIVLCDIANFSSKRDWAQIACVTNLDKVVQSSRLWAILAAAPKTTVLQCTGDGFVLITTNEEVLRYPKTLLDFVRDILVGIDEWNRTRADDDPSRYSVRIGLNVGNFSIGIRVFGNPNAIGSGVNRAARVASIGDEGQVLVSEEFAALLQANVPTSEQGITIGGVEFCGPGLDSLVSASDVVDPWEVAVKHGELVKVRPWYCADLNLGDSRMPNRVKTLISVQEHLRDDLECLYRDLVSKLGRLDGHPSETQLDLRLTVLFANKKKHELVCTNVRFWRTLSGYDAPKQYQASGIVYPIHPDKFWGMPAHIYRDACNGNLSMQCQVDLPPWDSKKAQGRYAAKLFEKWQFPADQVRRLTRKARSYLGVPIVGLDRTPFGVLMVDTMSPLSNFRRQTKINKKVGSTLEAFARGRLPALLHVRYSP